MAFDGYELPGQYSLLAETVRRFVREEIWPVEQVLHPEAVRLPAEQLGRLQSKARDAGLWYLGAPEEYGGAGLSTFALAVVLEQAAQHRFGMPESGGGVFGYDLPVVLYGGTPAQIERYVRPTIAEGWRWFTAITEPSGGSDPARAIRTRAVHRDGRWVLSGRKMFSTGADEARFGVVYARTDPARGRAGVSAFIVPADAPGLRIRPVQVLRDHGTTELLLEDAEVPEENLLGEPGQGFALAQQWLVRGRVVLAAQCVGIAQAALEMGIEHVTRRETFGRLLASRQAVQWMLADSAVELRAARHLAWEAAWRDDQGQGARTEASIAKLYATEAAFRILDRMVQIHGGMGVAKEMNLEHWFRALRVSRIVEGPSEIHRFVIARDLLGAAALK